MKAIKNIGIVAVGLAVMLLVFSLPVIFVDGAVWVSDHVLPLMQDVIAYAVLACILMIPIALIPQTLSPPEPRRPVAGGARKAHLLRRGQERALEARRAGGVPRLCDGAGRRHVAELSDAVAAGHRAVMLHVVQRAIVWASASPPISTRSTTWLSATRGRPGPRRRAIVARWVWTAWRSIGRWRCCDSAPRRWG